ncbi:MAG: hypothetical protein C0434_04295 [Xanthomonadaceae bacterium]|nr:hypothetical protein [Xanthomonadaceae bacterium]
MSALPDADWRGLLLRQLPAAEAARLERVLLVDPQALAALRDAETDLHDDYARLQLTAAEHAAFRSAVLGTPAAQARQRFSQAMKPLPQETRRGRHYQPLARPRSRYGLRTAFTGVLIATALGLGIWTLRPELVTGISRHARGAALPAAAFAAEPTLLLLATAAPGGARPPVNVVLRRGARGLRVQAEVTQAEEARLYRIRLLDAADAAKVLLDIGGLPLQTAKGFRYVEVVLPAQLLAGGPRRLQVDALPPAGVFSDHWRIEAESTDRPPIEIPGP